MECIDAVDDILGDLLVDYTGLCGAVAVSIMSIAVTVIYDFIVVVQVSIVL